jgi:hypothetical protein
MLFIRPTNPLSHRLARFAFVLACVGGLTVGISGPLHRYLGLESDVAIGAFRYGFYVAAAAIALALATVVPTRPGDRRRGFLAAVLALAIGVAAAWAPINWLLRAREAPRINDITTDTANPPPLVVTLPLRQKSPNPLTYGGEAVASLRAGYPDIGPITLSAAGRGVRRSTRWRRRWAGTSARAPADGRIEAVDTTRWFGFHDDIVVHQGVKARPAAGSISAPRAATDARPRRQRPCIRAFTEN